MHFSSRHSLTNLLRIAALIALVATGGSIYAGNLSERMLAAIVSETPDTMLVPDGDQLKNAEAAAAEILGAAAFYGAGHSMEPLFTDGTAIVVAPINFRELKQGMTVVYINRRGRMVAHSLIGDLPKGWIAQGVGNDEEDEDLVTRENLVGVIVQAYAAASSEFRVALTQRLIANGRLAAGRS